MLTKLFKSDFICRVFGHKYYLNLSVRYCVRCNHTRFNPPPKGTFKNTIMSQLKATDLMIGDCIEIIENGQIAKITAIKEHFGVEVNNNIIAPLRFDQIKPIKLTVDRLLKCGFEIKSRCTFTKDGIRLINIAEKYFRGNFPIKADIEHLHELQNLYRVLTGNNLIIEL